MSNATIFTKVLTGGDHKGVILEPGQELLRETNLPANWLKIRLGFIGSWTNLADTNGLPTNETVVGVLANPKTSFNFGLSNGVGYFGDVGNRFVGFAGRRGSGQNCRMYSANSTTNWEITSGSTINKDIGPTIGDGVTLTGTSPGAISYFNYMPSPTASSTCLFSVCADLDLTQSASGRLTTVQNFSDNQAPAALVGPMSTASDAALNNRLMAGTYSSFQQATGGWWNQSGSTPVGCRHLSIRNPFQLNRLRIMNIMIQQLQ